MYNSSLQAWSIPQNATTKRPWLSLAAAESNCRLASVVTSPIDVPRLPSKPACWARGAEVARIRPAAMPPALTHSKPHNAMLIHPLVHGMKTWRHPWNRKSIMYRNTVRGGPSHGHRQHAQKIWWSYLCPVPLQSFPPGVQPYCLYILLQHCQPLLPWMCLYLHPQQTGHHQLQRHSTSNPFLQQNQLTIPVGNIKKQWWNKIHCVSKKRLNFETV